MPFIGKSPTAGFSTIVKDDLTADGSTTAFTLSKQVASANDIAVFVGNVRQEPTDAYSVSGTTLTMTAAPASGINFYVLHIAGTLESSVIPADNTISTAKIQNNAISGAKLDTTVDYYRAGTSEFMIGSDNGGTAQLTFYEANTSTKEGFLKYDGLNNKVVLGTSGASDAMEIARDTGYITKPNQPSFAAGGNGNSVYSGEYFLGDNTYGNRFDVGNNYNYTNGRFTAPIAGKYLIIYTAIAENNASHFVNIEKNGANYVTPNPYLNYGLSYQPGTNVVILDLAVNDYIRFKRRGSSGYDIYMTYVAGYFLG